MKGNVTLENKKKILLSHNCEIKSQNCEIKSHDYEIKKSKFYEKNEWAIFPTSEA